MVIQAYECKKEEVIHTMEGDMVASVGDYVIIGLKGERYPCKPDVFWASYEEADEDALLSGI